MREVQDTGRVFFGAWVDLEDAAGQQRRYRIVGSDEFDADPAYISMDSPLARALLGRRIDDEVTVSLPRGEETWVVVDVDYHGPAAGV